MTAGRSVIHLLVGVAVLSCALTTFSQDEPTVSEAGFDSRGNVYVVGDGGKPIIMTTLSHCGEASGAPNRQTMICWVKPDQNSPSPTWNRLELYLRGGKKTVIQTEAPIREWHFWNGGDQLAVFSGTQKHQGVHALYDSATGRVVESVPEPIDGKLLPLWAKSRAQLADESVPESPELSKQRTAWITKVLRQIQAIQPGMKRKDVTALFDEDGGLSFPTQQTYTYKDCPLIKIEVKFKSWNGTSASSKNADDIIESVSRPYLGWEVKD